MKLTSPRVEADLEAFARVAALRLAELGEGPLNARVVGPEVNSEEGAD